jgi:hypothetical protein
MCYTRYRFLHTIGNIRRHHRQATSSKTRTREPQYYLQRAFNYNEIKSARSHLLAHQTTPTSLNGDEELNAPNFTTEEHTRHFVHYHRLLWLHRSQKTKTG